MSGRIPWGRFTLVFAIAVVLASIVPGAGPTPGTTGPFGLLGADLWLHGGSFLVLGAMSRQSLGTPSPRTLLTLFAGLALLGGALEVAQHWIPGRAAELSDALADAVGAGVGVVLAGFSR